MSYDRAFDIAPQVRVSSEGKYAHNQKPFEKNGIFHFPSAGMSCGVVLKDNGDRMVQLDLTCTSPIGNSLGIFLRMTPDGARELAGFLIDQARQVEAHVEQQATAAIEKARKP